MNLSTEARKLWRQISKRIIVKIKKSFQRRNSMKYSSFCTEKNIAQWDNKPGKIFYNFPQVLSFYSRLAKGDECFSLCGVHLSVCFCLHMYLSFHRAPQHDFWAGISSTILRNFHFCAPLFFFTFLPFSLLFRFCSNFCSPPPQNFRHIFDIFGCFMQIFSLQALHPVVGEARHDRMLPSIPGFFSHDSALADSTSYSTQADVDSFFFLFFIKGRNKTRFKIFVCIVEFLRALGSQSGVSVCGNILW